MSDLAQPLRLAVLGSRGFPSTYGGYETLVRYLARDWTQRGHHVTVYCRRRHGGASSWFTEGVECIWTPGFESKNLSTLSFGATSHFHAAARRYDAALVLNVANGFYLPALRARGVPTVVNTDGIEWERAKWGAVAQRAFRAGARMTARYADVLVADSRAIAAIWQARFDVESLFIPYGAPVLHDTPSTRLSEIGVQPRSYVLVVARLIPENNVELVLDAIDRMPNRPPAVVVGGANFANPVEARLRSATDRGLVRWLGHLDDQELLTQLWANAGVYVHGHSVGGTNPGLLQALGAGAPTLALDTQFNAEVLSDGRQLFPHDPSALADRIDQVLAQPSLQAAMSENGKGIVEGRYRWADVCDAYLDALLLARSRMRARAESHMRERSQ